MVVLEWLQLSASTLKMFLLVKWLYTLPCQFLIDYSCVNSQPIAILNNLPDLSEFWSFSLAIFFSFLSNIFLLQDVYLTINEF